jgi:hypothetical protein
MSLPHMNWRYVGTRGFGSAGVNPTAEDLLNAIFNLATQTTYADGTTRTQGSGSAGTWQQSILNGALECIYVSPPVNPLNQRIMLGGAAGTPASITMQSADTYVQNNVMVNLVKNAGAEALANFWYTSDPFDGGEVFGWGKWWPFNFGYGNVFLWESSEAIAVATSDINGNNVHCVIAGALIDSETGDTVTDAESDGRLYGVIRTGAQTSATSCRVSPTFWTDNYNRTQNWNSYSRFMFYNGSSSSTVYNSLPSAAVFSPSTNTLINMIPMTTFTEAPTLSSLKTRSSQFVSLAMLYRNMASDCVLGRLRDIYMFTDAQLGQRLVSGTDPAGYVISGSTTTNSDAIFLEHGP